MILQIKRSQSCEVVTDIITQTKKGVQFQTTSRFSDILWKNSVSWFWKNTNLCPKIYGNTSRKNKWIQFFKEFQKRNQKLVTTKSPLQTSQAIYKWRCVFFHDAKLVIYNLGVLRHVSLWDIFRLAFIRTFWLKKIR